MQRWSEFGAELLVSEHSEDTFDWDLKLARA